MNPFVFGIYKLNYLNFILKQINFNHTKFNKKTLAIQNFLTQKKKSQIYKIFCYFVTSIILLLSSIQLLNANIFFLFQIFVVVNQVPVKPVI